MSCDPLFVPGGVYLRTPTGELIGRLEQPGAPFETLDEARSKLDWLVMVMQFQQEQCQRGLVGVRRSIPAGEEYARNEPPGSGSAGLFEV